MIIMFFILFPLILFPCTEFYFQVNNDDKDLIIGRTLDVSSKEPCVIILNDKVGQVLSTGTESGTINLSKTVLYKWLSITSFAQEYFFCEALNNVGLKISMLFFPEATYAQGKFKELKRSVNMLEIVPIALATCSTADEVRRLFKGTVIWCPEIVELLFDGKNCPFHIVATDSLGKSIVIEIVNGFPVIYDNNTHVVTNTPTYYYHIQDLRNFIRTTSDNSESIEFNGISYKMMGHGNGFFGIPGDYTSTSRFNRIFYFLQNINIPNDLNSAISLAQNLLCSVRVSDGLVADDLTTWETILTKDTIYFRNYNYSLYKGLSISEIFSHEDGWFSYIDNL
jgi:penicillin V acylase-like amidase (Ntn superfamily)